MSQQESEKKGQAVGESIFAYRKGIIIGAVLGLLTGKVWAIVIGGAIGFFIQRGIKKVLKNVVPPQLLFFKATFMAMGKLAKADGRVTESEIQFARAVMDQMRLSEERRKEAIAYFTEGKSDECDLDAVLRPLSIMLQRQPAVKIAFVEIQLQAAMADGQASQPELDIIRHICMALRMSSEEMMALMARVQAHQSYYQHSQSGGAGYVPESQLLEEAYGVLGVSASSTDADVKKAYRKLMSQHHPDKLVSKGLPEEMMAMAKEKAQEIQSAYDRVKQSRGMR
jgi:DnaJ like chaperone protein